MQTRPRHVAAIVLALALSSSTVQAEAPSGPAKYVAIEDVVYGHKDGLALTLDVLTPATGAKGIGVVLVSSGGWKSEKSDVPGPDERRRNTEHWVQGLLRGGYTLFVTRHGSAPRYYVPEMVDDIRRSVRFARHHADRFHVDPQHLGITSGSSGGHLSLMVAMTGDDGQSDAKDPILAESSRVQAVVAWFPPTDLINWGKPEGYREIEQSRPGFFANIFGKVTDLEGQLRSISPIYAASADDPPLLLIHGDKDRTVPLQQSEVLQARYAELGLPVELIVQPGGGHTYWPGILDQYTAVAAWFDKFLQPQSGPQ
ncbi:MAG: prolyl oligopeptidase family serine peptidase [Pirellulales bacterium]